MPPAQPSRLSMRHVTLLKMDFLLKIYSGAEAFVRVSARRLRCVGLFCLFVCNGRLIAQGQMTGRLANGRRSGSRRPTLLTQFTC